MNQQTSPEVIMAKIPAMKTAGNMSSSLPQRSAMVKIAKPQADARALRLPAIRPSDIPLSTMIAIPTMAAVIAIQVARRTLSRNTIQPKKAARNGAAANRNIALATLVVWIA